MVLTKIRTVPTGCERTSRLNQKGRDASQIDQSFQLSEFLPNNETITNDLERDKRGVEFKTSIS